VDELATAIIERDLASAVIGCELGVGQRLGMPYSDFEALRQRLRDVRCVDATDLLWSLRRIKSDAEIGYLRQAARITGQAVSELMQNAREGWTERQVYRHIASRVMSLGADRPGYIPVNADSHAPDSLTGGPTERTLLAGRTVYLGAGCVFRGYWSDLVRCLAVGRASDHQRRMYAAIGRAMDQCLAIMRPGIAVADVMRASLAAFEAAGLQDRVNRGGRIGLGTGLDLSEPPSISLDDSSTLEAGMVLYIEPNCQTEEGNFMVEETVLVTDEGIQMLSTRAPRDIPVVG
jgi:Xaa-Pro aminopeptidase